MKILISIDDTDNIESRGTGEIADLLAAGIMENCWGKCGPVTRHQLLIHPDIPYTSHNSSMCFPAEICEDALDSVTDYCCSTLAAESAAGSDPGLCILVPERLERPEVLVRYGQKAKKAVISKEEAYETAAVNGIHLSEHGGTGQGVIGALAGAGLRLTGNDGRFKGKFRIPSRNGMASVKDIRKAGIEVVRTVEGMVLNDIEVVHVGDWVKPVLLDEKSVLLVVSSDVGTTWNACERRIFEEY
jgi:hypothetical protein